MQIENFNFRVFDFKQKRYLDYALLENKDGAWLSVFAKNNAFLARPSFSLELYSGFKDSSGELIFENDVLETKKGELLIIGFKDGSFTINEKPLIYFFQNEDGAAEAFFRKTKRLHSLHEFSEEWLKNLPKELKCHCCGGLK